MCADFRGCMGLLLGASNSCHCLMILHTWYSKLNNAFITLGLHSFADLNHVKKYINDYNKSWKF